MTSCDVSIIGAGPYGLSAAAHLCTVKGLELRVFGEPMSFWRQNMPVGMFLRSNWTATQIASPTGSLTLEAFQAETGNYFETPVPLEQFVQYGRWYQKCAVPALDQRRVTRVERDPKGFSLTLHDGEVFRSRRVIVAGGIAFVRLATGGISGPPPFAGLSHLRSSRLYRVRREGRSRRWRWAKRA